MAFGTGYAAVQDSLKKAAERNSSGKFAHPIDSLWSLTWKEDGEVHTVRFLSDNVVSFPMHTYVTTKDGKHRDFACTKELEGELQRPCFICDNLTKTVTDQKTQQKKTIPHKPTDKVFGILVERAVNEEGEVVDVTREMDILVDPNKPDGATKKVEVPKICILSQGTGFWDQMNGFYMKYKKTTVDRDYDIVRKGTGLQTKYQPLPGDKDLEINTAEQLWDFYDIPRDGDKDPAREAIIKWIERQGTPAYFDRYLNTGNVSADEDVEPEEAVGGYDEEPVSAPTGTNFASLRAGLTKKYKS